jgi:basic membrane protein A
MRLATLFALLLGLTAGAANATYKPAIVYLYSGSESDRAFIDAAQAGIDKAAHEFGQPIAQHRMMGTENITAVIKRVADSGASPIIAVGYQNVMPVLNLAERYPNTQFTVIDGIVPPLFSNVQSVIFKDHEGAFLVGMIAARLSKSGHISFIGGMDIPLIRNFSKGYAQGARYANHDISIDSAMVGTTPDAWSNPDAAHALATTQYKRGVDVIFAAAGGSGLGVLKAAEESHRYAIGVDTNQNGLYPGSVLTSLVKRVDIAVYEALKASHDGNWSAGIKYLGIKEGALDYAVDQNNKTLISEQLIEEVAMAKERIINGTIEVEMYSPK